MSVLLEKLQVWSIFAIPTQPSLRRGHQGRRQVSTQRGRTGTCHTAGHTCGVHVSLTRRPTKAQKAAGGSLARPPLTPPRPRRSPCSPPGPLPDPWRHPETRSPLRAGPGPATSLRPTPALTGAPQGGRGPHRLVPRPSATPGPTPQEPPAEAGRAAATSEDTKAAAAILAHPAPAAAPPTCPTATSVRATPADHAHQPRPPQLLP